MKGLVIERFSDLCPRHSGPGRRLQRGHCLTVVWWRQLAISFRLNGRCLQDARFPRRFQGLFPDVFI
jgi:hypothetical protein